MLALLSLVTTPKPMIAIVNAGRIICCMRLQKKVRFPAIRESISGKPVTAVGPGSRAGSTSPELGSSLNWYANSSCKMKATRNGGADQVPR